MSTDLGVRRNWIQILSLPLITSVHLDIYLIFLSVPICRMDLCIPHSSGVKVKGDQCGEVIGIGEIVCTQYVATLLTFYKLSCCFMNECSRNPSICFLPSWNSQWFVSCQNSSSSHSGRFRKANFLHHNYLEEGTKAL